MALQTQQVGYFEGGLVLMFLVYDDVDGRVQQVHYKNETPYPTYLTISFVGGNPREFPFPAETPYTVVDIPRNARPNVTIDNLSLSMGFSPRAQGGDGGGGGGKPNR